MSAAKKDNILLGGVSSMAAAFATHPLDLLKVRLQAETQRAGPKPGAGLKIVMSIIRQDGILALYNGLSASLLRQGTYSTVRFGAYDYVKNHLTSGAAGPNAFPLYQKIGVGMLSGAMGGLCGNPADVVNIRMQADGKLDPALRRNYKHAIDGLIRITREEGVGSLFSGLGPNVGRAMLMTAAQLASYDSIKASLLRTPWFKDNMVTHFTASLAAGFVATVVCAPVDIVKTRLMNAPKGEVMTASNCFATIARNEGLGGFYKGFVPAFVRLGPHTVITFMVLEQLRKYF